MKRSRILTVFFTLILTLLFTTTAFAHDGSEVEAEEASESAYQGFYHFVTYGETLYSISRLYGVPVADLQAANFLGSSTTIYAGTYLYIPPSGPATGGPDPYVVRSGDTLYRLAVRFGTTVSALQARNGLGSSTSIYTGQSLFIPATATRIVHTVQPGQTLSGIAAIYGTSVGALQTLNNISNVNVISAGDVLAIP